jgi:hypothetical protein
VAIAAKGTPVPGALVKRRRHGLKMPDLRPMIGALRGRAVDMRRLLLISSLIAMALALDGCTKCGPIWDDWTQSPKSCKSDRS